MGCLVRKGWIVLAEEPVAMATKERRMNVLVVETNPTARERVLAALGECYVVRFVSGASEALAAVDAQLPDLLVTEVDLEDGDGLALCEQVRARPKGARLPIMLLTSRTGIRDKVAGFQAGADDYVVKPLDTRLFHARVRLLCRIKGLERRVS
jgi:DNA-binding response OmpR family regulator